MSWDFYADLDQIASKQGWTDETLLEVTLEYLDTPERREAFLAHLREVAANDNAVIEASDDSMDGDHESALASAGFGTDEDYGGGGYDGDDGF